ncbi:MAG: hypothetical protein HKP61_13660 [Dactylosporangium sp.]|nr:hypothetical protein [Dactylosporangium sp.]NNJ61960.1 hypothetical protein [Dactylosporangium sp.]
MRHLGSFVLALLLVPPIAALLTRGAYQSEHGMAASTTSDGSDWRTEVLIGLVLLVSAGVLYAVLALPRFSPLGPASAGLLLVGLGGWIMVDLDWFLAHRHLGPVDLHPSEPGGVAPLLVAIGVPLIATAFNPRRWRGESPSSPALQAGIAQGHPTTPTPPSSGYGYPQASQSYPQTSQSYPQSPAPLSTPYGPSGGAAAEEPETTMAMPLASSNSYRPAQPPPLASSSSYHSTQPAPLASSNSYQPAQPAHSPSSAPPSSSPPSAAGSFNGFLPAGETRSAPNPYQPAHEDPETTQRG